MPALLLPGKNARMDENGCNSFQTSFLVCCCSCSCRCACWLINVVVVALLFFMLLLLFVAKWHVLQGRHYHHCQHDTTRDMGPQHTQMGGNKKNSDSFHNMYKNEERVNTMMYYTKHIIYTRFLARILVCVSGEGVEKIGNAVFSLHKKHNKRCTTFFL